MKSETNQASLFQKSFAQATKVSLAATAQRVRERELQAKGQIVGLETRSRCLKNGDWLVFEYPVVRYATASGEEIEFRSTQGSTPGHAHIGDAVTVVYETAHPYAARLQ